VRERERESFLFLLNILFFRKVQEREHTDSTSFSWVLMRYTIVRLIHKRLWAFFPEIGIEKQEVASVSPLIQQLLQNLRSWQDGLRRTLESFNTPPDNYLPMSSLNTIDEQTSTLPIHRYRTILDPQNTPFSYEISLENSNLKREISFI